MTLDDAVAYRQPQTRTMHTLGGIERLEDTLAHLFFHTGSGIGKSQSQSLAFTVTANRQTAALRHCVYGVDDQIYKHLSQLRSIAKSKQIIFGVQSHIKIRAFGARFVLPAGPRDLDRVAQETRDVKQLQVGGYRLARKCLNSPHGCRGILGRRYNNAKTANQVFIRHPAKNKLRSTQNCRQRIIEIMRHSGSQLTQSAQLVRSGSPIALLLLFGNIVCNAEHAGHLSVDNDGSAVYRGKADAA